MNNFSPKLTSAIANCDNKSKFENNVGSEFAHSIKNTELPYTVWEYHCAFDLVANIENWKLPINTTIDIRDRDITKRAVIDATGTIPTFLPVGSNQLQITADGYYTGIGE
jgi:hypothetical protein